eukprot:COSAG05_NODE_1166_length_5633_cov_4.256957_1_plen_168_part_00
MLVPALLESAFLLDIPILGGGDAFFGGGGAFDGPSATFPAGAGSVVATGFIVSFFLKFLIAASRSATPSPDDGAGAGAGAFLEPAAPHVFFGGGGAGGGGPRAGGGGGAGAKAKSSRVTYLIESKGYQMEESHVVVRQEPWRVVVEVGEVVVLLHMLQDIQLSVTGE